MKEGVKLANYCGECAHLDLKNKERYTSKDRYYCDKRGRYCELTDSSCYNFLKDPSRLEDRGSYRPSGCYITTIVVDILGYEDNCEILNVLRNFRETYLKLRPEYLSLLIEYDRIGPVISESIQNYNHKLNLCLLIMKKYLLPCASLIKENNFEDAIKLYEKMIINLEDFFGIQDIYTKVDYDTIDINNIGKGRIRVLNKHSQLVNN